MPSQQNLNTVAHIKDQLKTAKSVVLTDYSSINVADQTKLRAAVAKTGGQFTVHKNRLFKIAIKDFFSDGLPHDFEEVLHGQTAFLFSHQDAVSAIKALYQFAAENENLEVKLGILDGKVLTGEEVKALSKLPSKKELIAKLTGQLQATTHGLVNVLSGTTKKLVYALTAIKETKSD